MLNLFVLVLSFLFQKTLLHIEIPPNSANRTFDIEFRIIFLRELVQVYNTFDVKVSPAFGLAKRDSDVMIKWLATDGTDIPVVYLLSKWLNLFVLSF